MYEELVKRLRDSEHEIDCSLCDRDCCYPDGKVHGKCIIIEAADAIENTSKAYQMMAEAYEAEVTKSRWIPVTERLPDESEPVLAYVCWPDYTDNEICYGQYIKNGRFRLTHYVEGELIKGYEVKAWMPLPAPPKEET